MERNRVQYVLALTALVAGCGKLPGFSVDEKSDAFLQSATRNDKIDVLFIVDNSGSMADEQATLASSFSNFITKFTNKNLNYHIGVTTTDTFSVTAYWQNTGGYVGSSPYINFPNNNSGSLLAKSGNDRYITSSSVNPTLQFTQNVSLGISGSGAESGLLAATQFFGAGKLAGWNSGFLRSDAYLSIIIVSDEDESIGDSDGTYIKNNAGSKTTRVNNFLTAVRATKSTADQSHIRFDAVVGPSLATCPTLMGASSAGTVYMEVAATLGGITSNICNDFSTDIESIGAALVAATTRFHLAQPPVGGASGISVTVDGVGVAQDATNGWTYLEATQEVEFHGTAIPGVNARISVNYVPAKPI